MLELFICNAKREILCESLKTFFYNFQEFALPAL